MTLKVLRFLKPMAPYNPGETAGFNEIEADRILRMNGVAIEDKTITPREPTRSAGLDPPNFSLQQIAGVMQHAAMEAVADKRK